MATDVTIGGSGQLFAGEDKTLTLEVLQDGAPLNLTGMAIMFEVRVADASSVSLLTKTAAVTGVFSATRNLNTQRAVVQVVDTDTALWTPRAYRHSWKRMDDGSETVFARGNFIVEKATAP